VDAVEVNQVREFRDALPVSGRPQRLQPRPADGSFRTEALPRTPAATVRAWRTR